MQDQQKIPHRPKDIYPEPIKAAPGGTHRSTYNTAAALAMQQNDLKYKAPAWHDETRHLGLFLFVLAFVAFVGSIVSAGMRLAFSSTEISLWQAYWQTHGIIGIAVMISSFICSGIFVFSTNYNLVRPTIYIVAAVLVFQVLWALLHLDFFGAAIGAYLLYRLYELSLTI